MTTANDGPNDPHEGIKTDADPETAAVERDQTSYVARAGQSSGTVSSGTDPGDEQPSKAVGGGTAGGDALAGVTASAEDVEEAVSGDTGPEHAGQRR